jgi:uncharacterized protein (TIGR03067 family)
MDDISRYGYQQIYRAHLLDPAATPKTIDSSPAADPSKPILGIYEFDGETLKICNAQPGKPRPADFEAKAGSGYTLTVWQPEKH